jgi:chromate reductase
MTRGEPTKYTIISGTNRTNARSRKISDYYQRLLKEHQVDSQIIDLNDLPRDFIFSGLYDQAGKNPIMEPIRQQVSGSDKLVFIVAEYNGGFPGVLKAFIDGMEFPHAFRDKKAALVGLSSGVQGAGLALSHLTDILNYCGTHVLALKPKLAHIDQLFDGMEFTDSSYEQRLKKQVEAFVKF